MKPRIPKSIRCHGLDFEIWPLADGRLAFDYQDGGRRRVVKRRSLEKLRADADRIALAIVNADTAAKGMTADDHRIFVNARDALAPHGVAVDSVARDAADAFSILGRVVSLREVARYFVLHNPDLAPAPPTGAIADELLDVLAEKGRSSVYRTRLKTDLARFALAHPDITACREADISGYLRKVLASGASQRRRDNIRDGIVRLFRFARDRRWLPADQKTAAEHVDRVAPGVDHVSTFTPAEISTWLEHASRRWVPFFALGAFAGLRTSEILRLDWAAVKWEQSLIAVSRSIARKVRISRLVPMLPNLAAWLSPWRDHVGGPVFRFKSEAGALSALDVELRRIEGKTGLRWKKNALRHSFGSYRLAIIKNPVQLALEMGNSPAQIREHYHDPKPESDATKYFAVGSDSADKVLPLPLQFAR